MTCRCFCSNTFNDITYCPLHKAAPDMLELLEEFARTIDDDHFYKDRLTAVLQKAKGAL